ncbi:MAG: sulfite exporter TauE/SafE family protein [Actinotalea sp.]|nr:sulfite exporter TauE/SafE family protein [Actinotalea sp.]
MPHGYGPHVELTATVVGVGLVAAFVFGVSKTAVPAVSAFGVALLATVLPPVPSTGVALPVLIVVDVFAIVLYGRHADRGLLLRLLPSVVVGLAAGWTLVRLADPAVVTRVIGVVLLLSVAGALVRRRADAAAPARAGGPVALLLGAGAGLSTMVANAGGPMMTLYLLRMRVGVLGFLGTVSWFFAAVNVLKVPFSVGLGLITPESLVVSAALVPGAVAGALLGRRLVRGMSVEVFRALALTATAAAGVWLVVR